MKSPFDLKGNYKSSMTHKKAGIARLIKIQWSRFNIYIQSYKLFYHLANCISYNFRVLLLRAFAKLWKAAMSFVMSVGMPVHPSVCWYARPSVRLLVCPSIRRSVCLCVCPFAWNSSAPTRRIFMKFYIWVISKTCQENSSFTKIWYQ
jgi:hypothetical protein